MEKVRGVPIRNGASKRCVCVHAEGLELEDDRLHLTAKTQVQSGQMLADAQLQHFSSSKSNSHPAL